jgi:predicted GIY-YIG superfamily endonuclease
MHEKYYVYHLINPINLTPFYVGKTYSLNRRLKQHLKLTTPTSAKAIKILLENNIIPIIEEIYNCKYEIQALKMEQFFIKNYKERGIFLTNHLCWNRKNYIKNMNILKNNIKIK